jgi:hypothetical protein
MTIGTAFGRIAGVQAAKAAKAAKANKASTSMTLTEDNHAAA